MSKKHKKKKGKREMFANYRATQQSCLISAFDDLRLTFHPSAWLKLQYLCHKAKTEVGGFGIALNHEKPLYLDDILIPAQECTSGYCDLDMQDFARLSDPMLQELKDGRVYNPAGTQVWIHTHPSGIDATPSGKDEETFKERGGDWAVMFILSQNGTMSCRIKVKTAFGFHAKEIPVRIDWSQFCKDWEGGVFTEWDKLLETVKERPNAVATLYESSGYIQSQHDRWLPEAYKRRGQPTDTKMEAALERYTSSGRRRGAGIIPPEYEPAWEEYMKENGMYGSQADKEADAVFAEVEAKIRGE